jgi:hypothetical protein
LSLYVKDRSAIRDLLRIGHLKGEFLFMSEIDVNVISAPPVKQPIIENAVYEREEAIAITGFSLSTLIRAEKSGGLTCLELRIP